MNACPGLPVHIYEATSGKPVVVILRPDKPPDGREVRAIIKHVLGHIRRCRPRVRIPVRGDSHYVRSEAMAWCGENGVDYVFGLACNGVLQPWVQAIAEDLCVRGAESGEIKRRI